MALLMIDLDNTLADRQAAFDHWLDHLAASCAGIAADREWIRVHDADGYRSREVFLDELRQRHRLNRSLDDLLAEYRRVTTEGFRPTRPDILRRLDEVRARGARIAVVTNGDAEAQNATFARTLLSGHVDALVVSGGVGFRKPDRRIFESAAQRCGTTLEDAWMIGDGEVDVLGGQACGARTVWLHRGRRWPCHISPPDHEVADVADALDLWLDHP